MIDKTQAERLAHMATTLRPDWPTRSLLTFIERNLTDRAYRDVAVALAWVAADPESKTPARLLEAGPWWKATVADAGTTSAITHRCPEHPQHTAWNCPTCAELAGDPEAGIAAARAALRSASRMTLPVQRPEPKPRDLDDVRARADREAAS